MSTAGATKLQNQPFTLRGKGGAVLLVHGLGGGPYETQWLGEALHARTGLTVRAIHLPGHEVPSRRMPASRHEDWVAKVAAAREALSRELAESGSSSHGESGGSGGAESGSSSRAESGSSSRAESGSSSRAESGGSSRAESGSLAAGGAAARLPVHLVGFSTGCTICLRVAEVHGSTGKLALLAPFIDIYKPPLLPVRPEALLDLFSGLEQVPRRGPPLQHRELRREVARCLPFPTMNLDAARSAKALGELVMRDIEKVQSPVLIIQGMRDTVVDPRGAVRIETRLRCERKLVMLEDSDHLVGLDRERERVFDEVCLFLRPG